MKILYLCITLIVAWAIGAAFFNRRLGWLGGSVTVLLIGLVAWGSYMAATARDIARTAAKSASACIQVPDGTRGYRPAADLADLSPFSMETNSGRFHGLLVIESDGGRRLFNWSYRQASWSALPPGAERLQVIRCIPRPGYLERLGWLTGLSDLGQSEAYFRMERSAYLVPASFQPATQNATYLQFEAPAPGFVPDAATPAGSQYRIVSLAFQSRDWLESVAISERSASNLAEATPTSDHHLKSYVERDPEGRVVTLISCHVSQSSRNPAPCQHRFYMQGAMWYFRQALDDLPRWRELQQRLQERVGDFAAAAGKCESSANAC